jgi:hypothetical protein
MFGGETNVSVGQFAIKHRNFVRGLPRFRIGVAPSRSKPSVICSESGFSSKKTAQSFKITTTSSTNVCGRAQIYEDQCKQYSEP